MDENNVPTPGSATISQKQAEYDAIQSTATKEPANAGRDKANRKKETFCCNKCTDCKKKTALDN